MNENQIVFDSVVFDKNDQTFTVLNGSIGTYSLEEVVKCSVAGESSKFKGKSDPFTHTVITGVGVASTPLFEPGFYVGLKVHMKNGAMVAIYISKKEVRMNTDDYLKDKEEAEKIKKVIDKKGNVHVSKKENNIKKVKESGKKFAILHKDLVQYWKGRSIFIILAIVGGLLVSIYNIDVKKIFPNIGGKATFKDIVENAVYQLDELKSYDVIDMNTNTTIHIENDDKKEGYEATHCNNEICKTYIYEEDKAFVMENGEKKQLLANRSITEEYRSFKIENIDEFVGKIPYQYDILGKLPEFFVDDLEEKLPNGSYFSWDYPKKSISRYYKEKYELTKGYPTSVYTVEDIIYVDNDTPTQLDDTLGYDFTIYVDTDGYITLAKLSFEDDVYNEAYYYTFTNFEKK